MSRDAVRAGALALLLGAFGGACGAFGGESSSSGGPAGGADAAPESGAAGSRAVLCGDTACGDGLPCCATEAAMHCSSDRCKMDEKPIYCDDTADCAPLGLLCCIGRSNTTLAGATCKSSCDDADVRACNPAVPGECGPGKGCVTAQQALGFGFAEYAFMICEL